MKTKRPYDCGTFEEICELQTDGHNLKDWWMSTDGKEIEIYEQSSGEHARQQIAIPKRQFDALISWYMRGQPITPHTDQTKSQ